jgi:hypothetical protein
MPQVHYYTQKDRPGVMLPTRSHYVDAHGTIHAHTSVMGKLNKKGRRAWRQALRENAAKKG